MYIVLPRHLRVLWLDFPKKKIIYGGKIFQVIVNYGKKVNRWSIFEKIPKYERTLVSEAKRAENAYSKLWPSP